MAEYNSAYTGEQIDEAIGQVPHKADTTLSNLTDNATAIYNLGAASNPNLLDNWYFADPIDQRQGYVVGPGTAYYSDTGLSAQAGTVAAYTTAEYADGVYGSVTVDNAEYYVDWTAAVRGYTGIGYTIDRWNIHKVNSGLIVDEDGITFWGTDTGTLYFRQFMEDHGQLNGREVTVSVLTKDGALAWAVGKVPETISVDTPVLHTDFNEGTARIAFHKTTAGTLVTQFSLLPSESSGRKEAGLKAVKLELGSVQTIAHQDADGNWVLNDPPPNRALELAKCQRYQNATSLLQVPIVADRDKQMLVPVSHPVHMRIFSPTLTVSSAIYAVPTDGGEAVDLSSLLGSASVKPIDYGAAISFKNSEFVVGKSYVVNISNAATNYISDSTQILLDANL